jgi:uncharacterized membrane protein
MRALSPARIALYGAIVVVSLALAGLSLARHFHLGSAEDVAMFDQMLWNVREGRGLWTTISGNPNLLFPHHFFGEHVSPILFLIAPLAGLTSGPEALLVLQAVAIGVSAVPAGRIVGAALGTPRAELPGGMAWLALPGLWGATLFEFHMEAFGPLFLFSFWLAFVSGSGWAWLWAVLYAACKEDAPFYLAALSFAGGWSAGRWRAGALVGTAALAYGLVTLLWLQPSFSPTGRHLIDFRLITPERVGGLIPWFWAVLAEPERWAALAFHLLSFAGFPVLSGALAAPAMLAVGAMWLSNDPAQFKIAIHYPLTVYPLLFIAGIAGARRFYGVFGSRPRLAGAAVSGLAGIALIGSWGVAWSEVRDIVGAVGGVRTEIAKEARQILSGIPRSGLLATDLSLVGQVARREALTLLVQPGDADWLAVRLDGGGYPIKADQYRSWLEELLSEGSGYGLWASGGGVGVLKRGHSKDLNPSVLAELRQTFEAEDLYHGVGRVVRVDADAINGRAWKASIKDPDGVLFYGPYIDWPPGAYRVSFRVRTEAREGTEVAVLDVAEGKGGSVLGRRVLRGSSKGYEEMSLEAVLTGAGDVEFRCFKIGKGTVWIDRIRWEPLKAIGGKGRG